jgi:diguanylate cyclase (GGDEF)-like protein
MFDPLASWGASPAASEPYAANECWALRRGKPYRFGNDLRNPACAHYMDKAPKHTLCLPLLAQGESVGNLHISTDDEQDLMKPVEQRFLETAANSISLALANLRLRERLRIQSIRDALTGLYNRRYLDETLPREISRAKRGGQTLCLMLLDIDHFKEFNDTYGHDAGDFVLKSLAKHIHSFIRESDIACRSGGEEFVIILPETSIETASKRAEDLRAGTAQNELNFNNESIGRITISIGVSAYPQYGEEINTLIKSADEAMYQAKQGGRNRVVVKA